jgi:ATP-dependent Clp protease ATP-binding subunit ClpA
MTGKEDEKVIEQHVLNTLRRVPARFLNRIDETIVFHP